MNVLRGLLFDNLGLKLTALLLALLVYLNVYTDRPATLRMTFPVEFTDLPDSLSLSGPVPAMVEAELRGTGKQMITLRVREPRLQLSLGGVGPGLYQRTLTASDLPVPEGITVTQLVGPPMIEATVEARAERVLPAAVHAQGHLANGVRWDGTVSLDPPKVLVSGPMSVLARLDSARLAPLDLTGHRDSMETELAGALPEWCTMNPRGVRARVLLPRTGR